MKLIEELSNLQEQLDNFQKEDIASFYEKNKKIKTNSLISLIFSSLVAHSEKMEIYADLVQYYYKKGDFIEKHRFRSTLVSSIHQYFNYNRIKNYLSFCVQLLDREILFPKDIKMYSNFHFAIENPNLIQSPFFNCMLLHIQPETNILIEIYERRKFAYVNIPIANAIRNDDVELFKKITSIIPENIATQNFYQSITKKGQKMTLYDVTFEALLWFDRNELISVDPVSLVQYACFYGSVKCFKFMVANGAEVASRQLSLITTEEFTICGGCEEIIHICQQKGLDFFNESCLKRAIQFHHENIVNWILINSKIEMQTVINLCVSNNVFTILNNKINDKEQTIKFDIDEALQYIPSSDGQYFDISGFDMLHILKSYVEKDEEKNQTENKDEEKKDEEEKETENKDEEKKETEKKDEEKPIECVVEEVLKINADFQIALKTNIERFVDLCKTRDTFLGNILFCAIEAGCRARPYMIKDYSNVVKRVFDSIEDQTWKENEYKSFVDLAKDYLNFDDSSKRRKVKPLNEDENIADAKPNEEEEELSTNESIDSSCFDFRNKNSFICLVLYLIQNKVLNISDFNEIDCMKKILDDPNLIRKHMNGMFNNPIGNAIIRNDVESLKKLRSTITTDDIDPDELKYDWSGFIATYGHVNWLQYSALYRSPGCFTYLLQNVFTDPSFLQNCNTFVIIGSHSRILPYINSKFDKKDEYIPGILLAQRNKMILHYLQYNQFSFDEIQTIANLAFYFNNYELILFLIKSSIIEGVDLDEVALFCGRSLDMLYHYNTKMIIYYWNNGLPNYK